LEGATAVHEQIHFFKGHEIAVTERLPFRDDGKAIIYTHEAIGPTGEPFINETEFDFTKAL
jgi:hypothetical protein